MTEAAETAEAEKTEEEIVVETPDQNEEAEKKPEAPESGDEFVADETKSDEENAAALAEWEKARDEKSKADEKPGLPDDWRETAAQGDEEILKQLKRYGSLSGVAKALVEAKKTLRSGKMKQEMPDPSDEKAMAEWRKSEGIPDDPSGYVLPEDVTKRLVDEDKPVLSAFTEYAHQNNARPESVELAARWYTDWQEQVAEQQNEADTIAKDATEDALRKDWSHAEYKTNMKLAQKFVSQVPGLGPDILGLRAPDGRMAGSIPEFILWAAEQGRAQWGDLAFADGDAERKHTARKEEIEKIRDTDFDRYERDGLDKEYREILEKELSRKRA